MKENNLIEREYPNNIVHRGGGPYLDIAACRTFAWTPRDHSGGQRYSRYRRYSRGLWYRRKTTPFPYSQQWMLDKELPYLTRERLCQVLAPRPGERILEIGPGTGLFSVPIAKLLEPRGKLDVFDIQQVMLDHTLRTVVREGI